MNEDQLLPSLSPTEIINFQNCLFATTQLNVRLLKKQKPVLTHQSDRNAVGKWLREFYKYLKGYKTGICDNVGASIRDLAAKFNLGMNVMARTVYDLMYKFCTTKIRQELLEYNNVKEADLSTRS